MMDPSRGLKKYKDITMEITMETSLAGKVALVAGATRGAGRGIAVQLGGGWSDCLRHRENKSGKAIGNEPTGDDRRNRSSRG
jgi:hypothetical protein